MSTRGCDARKKRRVVTSFSIEALIADQKNKINDKEQQQEQDEDDNEGCGEVVTVGNEDKCDDVAFSARHVSTEQIATTNVACGKSRDDEDSASVERSHDSCGRRHGDGVRQLQQLMMFSRSTTSNSTSTVFPHLVASASSNCESSESFPRQRSQATSAFSSSTSAQLLFPASNATLFPPQLHQDQQHHQQQHQHPHRILSPSRSGCNDDMLMFPFYSWLMSRHGTAAAAYFNQRFHPNAGPTATLRYNSN